MERKDTFREETTYNGDKGNESAMTVSTHQLRPETFLPEKGTLRNLSSRESARLTASRKRRITAERYPQTPVSFVTHDLQDKEINSNPPLLPTHYVSHLRKQEEMDYATADSHCHFGWGSSAVSIPVSSLPSLVTSSRCSLYPITHELLFPS